MLVALDCEMVASGNRSILARVSIVDRCSNILLDEYVKPTATVTDYMTPFSGIMKRHLDDGKLFKVCGVQSRVSNLIRGKILVGHSLHFDLEALGLSHPDAQRRDLAKYGPFMKNGKKQSLKFLAQEHLNKCIQDGEHDSVTDAKTAMQLYNFVAKEWN